MQQLSSRERLLRTIAGEPVDRIPIWPPIPWSPLSGDPPPGDWKRQPNYERLVPLVAEHCDFLQHFMIPERGSSDGTQESPEKRAAYGGIFDRRFFLSPPELVEIREELLANGDRVQHYTVHTPRGDLHARDLIQPGIDTTWEVEPLVKTPEDAERLLSVPYRFDEPDMAAFHADVARLGDRGVPVVFVTTPMVMVSHMTDLQRFLEWTVSEPLLVERMIATAAERVTERLRYALDHGAGPVIRFGGSEQATPPLQSKRGFNRFIIAYERPLWQMAREAGRIVWVHCHGKISTVLDAFVAGGVQLTDPVEPPPQGDIDIADAKRRAAAGPLTLIGNVEQSDLRSLERAQVEELVRRTVCDGGRKHFILGLSDVVISELDDRTSDNLVTFLEAGVKYGSFDGATGA